ncbi:F-box/kelch-repeat protein At3g23880-like [Camellia sinensis]|uniref:F-box/kelch-repeat protein At3g23880-like n=1 Tax=Camellia sinensis TaxID=4442 RepID=UPI001036DDB3|nr:F-box/kelch-repeat protein At3g23880-like [Camellia sinensis]
MAVESISNHGELEERIEMTQKSTVPQPEDEILLRLLVKSLLQFRKHKILPNLDAKNAFTRACGFGYDKSTDDYKAVRIFSEGQNQRGGRGGGCLFIEKEFVHQGSSRALHWVSHVDTESSYSSWVIVSLDLEKETYGAIVPSDFGDCVIDLTLCVLKGCLHVLCNFSTCADVWVMNENGERVPWTKSFTIPYSVVSRICHCTPLCISKNGEILLKFENLLVLYNLKDGKFRNPGIPNMCNCLPVDTYVESLVSLDGNNLG